MGGVELVVFSRFPGLGSLCRVLVGGAVSLLWSPRKCSIVSFDMSMCLV